MCTLVISFDPEAEWPVLLAETRDEFRARAWEPPGERWPEHPGLVGGLDLESGGTWLAANPAQRRVAVILNRIEPTGLTDETARSRGPLTLLAAEEGAGAIAAEDLSLVRPFNLVVAEPGEVAWLRYDGADADPERGRARPPHPHRRRPRRHEQPAPALLAAGVRNGRGPDTAG